MLARKAHLVTERLHEWADRVHELRGLTLADRRGLVLVSTLAAPHLEESLAALAGSVLSQLDWADEEFQTGPVYAWRLSGRDRQLFVTPLTGDVALAAVTDSRASASAVELALLAIAREILSLAFSTTEEQN